MYDVDKLLDANRRYLNDFKPDFGSGPAMIGSGTILDIVDYKQYRRAGHGLPKTFSYQAVEGEYMTADDYEALIDDPTDFWLRVWTPRAFGAFEGLSKISPFPNLWEIVGAGPQMIPFGIPTVKAAPLMLTGTVEAVRAHCKDLIDTVGKGGGYVMGLGTAMDEGRADTLHEVIDFTREYGVYT